MRLHPCIPTYQTLLSKMFDALLHSYWWHTLCCRLRPVLLDTSHFVVVGLSEDASTFELVSPILFIHIIECAQSRYSNTVEEAQVSNDVNIHLAMDHL